MKLCRIDGTVIAEEEGKSLHLLAQEHKANLSRADLSRANLSWANLSGANLSGADLSWTSHDCIAELLRRSAGDDIEKRKIAGLVLISKDKCWVDFVEMLSGDEIEWCKEALRPWWEGKEKSLPDCARDIVSPTPSPGGEEGEGK